MASSKYIIVLTSSSKEFEAVKSHCESWTRDQVGLLQGTQFSVRIAPFMGYSLIVICSLKRGPRIALFLLQSLIHYQPSLVVFAGVAGGVGGNISLGSVVMSDHIVDLTLATEEESGTIYHAEVNRTSDSLSKFRDVIENESKWTQRIKPPNVQADEPMKKEVRTGTIGTGNVLAKADDGPLIRALLAADENACAIEMESASCLPYCQNYNTPYIAIRGISDFRIDKDEKTDRYRQPWAAAHACAVAFEFLQHFIAGAHQRGGTETAMDKSQPEEKKTVEQSSKQIEPRDQQIGPTAMAEPAPKEVPTSFSVFNKVAIRPARYRGTMFTIRISLKGTYDSASEAECNALGLTYADAIMRDITILEPSITAGILRRLDFVSKIYAQYEQGDWLEDVDTSKSYLVLARFEYGDAILRTSRALNQLKRQMLPKALLDLQEEEPLEQTKHFAGLILQKVLKDIPLEKIEGTKSIGSTENAPAKSKAENTKAEIAKPPSQKKGD